MSTPHPTLMELERLRKMFDMEPTEESPIVPDDRLDNVIAELRELKGVYQKMSDEASIQIQSAERDMEVAQNFKHTYMWQMMDIDRAIRVLENRES